MVAEARSAPVGTAGLPAVARSDSVRSGGVPVHEAPPWTQKSSTEACVRRPVLLGTKVCPAQVVELKPKPLLDTVRFCWLTPTSWASLTEPGVEISSQPEGSPAWNAFWELSVKQPGFAGAVSAKSCVAVPPLGTVMLDAEPVVSPSLLAVSDG